MRHLDELVLATAPRASTRSYEVLFASAANHTRRAPGTLDRDALGGT